METSGPVGSQGVPEMRATLQAQLGDSVRVLDVLGAHGSEYLLCARHVARGADVLVRALAADPAAESKAYWNFERRAEAAAHLEHPRILPAGPLQRGEGIAYYVVADLAARTVDSLLTDAQPSSWAHSLGILRDIASALDYAHGQGIVHGHLEPSSIVLRESGIALVSDFGAGSDAPASLLGRSSAYRAPEQWQREAVIDARADIYSLGVIAFELLTGRRRTISFSAHGVAIVDPLAVTHDVPLSAGLGLHVNQALLRAVSKRPMARFATAGQFIAELESQSDTAGHGLPTERPTLEIPRSPHFAFVPMAAVAALGITVGVIVVPSAQRVLHRWGDVSWVVTAHDLRIPELPAFSDAPLARQGKTLPAASDSEPLSDNNSSSSPSIFPGAATATRPQTPGSTPTSERPSPRSSVADERTTTTSSAGELIAPDSEVTGFIRVDYDGPSALVMVDEVPRGRTPYIGRVPPGVHTIRLVGSQSPFPIQQLRVWAGDTASASFVK